jgi:hypothetical protein
MEPVWQILWKREGPGHPRFWVRGLQADGRFLGVLNRYDDEGIWSENCVLRDSDREVVLASLAELEGDAMARDCVVPAGVIWAHVARGPADNSKTLFLTGEATTLTRWPAAITELIGVLDPYFGGEASSS